MNWREVRSLLLATLIAWLINPVQAAIQCTALSSPGVTINYTNQTTTSTQTYFQVTCSRAAGDPTTVTYSVTANNGQNPSGQNNQAMNGAAGLRYDVYVNSTCTTQWKGNTTITDTITWTSATDTSSITRRTNFWGCITAAQTATNSGLYSDTVGLTLSYAGGTSLTASVPVRIYAPASCTFTSQPGNIVISNYVPFTSATRTASSTFAVQCTNQMPYSLATNVTEAVAAGLRYTLSLSATTGSGTGAPQTYTVTVTVPAGQAGGTCGRPAGQTCTGVNSHFIMVTY